jgi:hypothetical protein
LKVVGKYYEQNQFAGDTAQSIMKGISFRFKDLQSLFLDVSKNKSVRFGTMSLDNQIIMSGIQSLVYCIQWTKRVEQIVFYGKKIFKPKETS